MKTKPFMVSVKLALLLCLLLPGNAGANNIVTSPDEASLRAAIKTGGWVSLDFNGTITITNTIAISNNVILDGSGVAATISGGNAVRLFYVAPGVTFSATNLTLANGSCLVTDGTADAGAIYNDGGTVTLTACTLTNDSAQSFITNYFVATGLARGGAIFNNGGVVLLNQSGISNNAAIGGGIGTGLGGALYNTNGTMTIMGCNVSSNLCEGLCVSGGLAESGLSLGGAVYQASGSLTITNSSFAFNQALGGISYEISTSPSSQAYGGATAITGGSVTIDHSQFCANIARGGDASTSGNAGPAAGGAVYSTSVLTVRDSSFFGNQSVAGNSPLPAYYSAAGIKATDGFGGAIYNSGIAVLNRCSVYSNYAQGESFLGSGIPGTSYPIENGGDAFGGGIFNAAQLAATNCTIAFNSASGGAGAGVSSPFPNEGGGGNASGGGVFNNNNATFIAMNLTIASNNCSSPYGYPSRNSPVYTNGLVAGAEVANANGTLRLHNSLIANGGADNAYGAITDDGYNICSDGTASLSSASSYNNTDPQLAPLADNGGPTWCMALLPTSPAIDTGDSAGSPNTDQRGYVRPVGAGPDIGAYEYGSHLLTGPYLNITANASDVLLSFTASPPSTYHLQASTNLTTWSDLTTYGPFASPTNISQSISRLAFDCLYFRLLAQ